MRVNEIAGTDSLAALLGERAVNLRQTILRAHRGMNNRIAQKFAQRGYKDIRPLHLSILANMNLGNTTIVDLCQRAQITENGVRDVADELVSLGYLRKADVADAKAALEFTDSGWELMLTSFNIQKELEAEFKEKLRSGDVDELRRILGAMFEEAK
jgi:DNA-binding MarR family transcriptional regulator